MTYKKILKSVDYPQTVLILDFETYFDSEYSLKEMSNIEYVTDPRFEFTGLGYQFLNTPVGDLSPIFKFPDEDIKSEIKDWQHYFGSNLEQVTVVGQNLLFDALILKQKFNIFPPFMIDIIALSRHQDARMKHDLDALAKKYKCQYKKGDTQQFKGLHYVQMTKEQKEKLKLYGLKDINIESELFQVLLPKLSNPQIELPLIQHTLKCYLQPNLQLNFGLARELKGKMNKELQLSLNKVDWITKYGDKKHKTVIEIVRSNLFVNALQDQLDENEKLPMKKGKNGPIPQLAKNDEGSKYLLEHKNPKVQNLMEARLASKSWGTHIKRIDSLINQAKCQNGKIGCPLWYYGGHTGRWSGTQGVNFQNFGGEGRRGSGHHPLIGKIKETLQAPTGYKLLISDLSQIEVRLLAWLAGQNDLLEDFKKQDKLKREGKKVDRDVYTKFASNLFNIPIRKPDDTDPPTVYNFLKIKRGFGKDTILGCGYGMGANKFYNECLANPALTPVIKSGEYDFQFIKSLIDNYRKTYTAIPKFWNTIEKAFRWVVKYPHETISYNRTIPDNQVIHTSKQNFGDLNLWNDSGTVNLQLPSGRILFYPHSSINKKGNLLWRWGHLYGGYLTENIIQAIARDILTESILNLEKNGFNVLLTIHDSVICVEEEKCSQTGLEIMNNIMCIPPTWGQNIPIATEGKVSKCLM